MNQRSKNLRSATSGTSRGAASRRVQGHLGLRRRRGEVPAWKCGNLWESDTFDSDLTRKGEEIFRKFDKLS